jgi:uncharacterized repeat protein (TIGR01451 family)
VTISGLTGQPATVTWTLYGPLRPAAQGCDGLGWTGAAIVAAATMAIVGDGRYPTAPAHLPQPGCYSYATEVSAPSGGFASMAGEPGATALVPAGAISAELTVDTAPPMYGHSLTYRMTVANTAAAVASDLKLLLVLPPGLDLVGATGPKVVTGRVLRWTVGSLAPGVSIELTAVVTPRLRATAEVLTSSFSVTNPPGFAPVALGTPCQQDPSRSCATTRVPAPAGSPQVVASHTVAVQVALARTDGRPAEYVRGQLVPWQLRVSNNGPDALTHISIVDAAVPACVLPVARLATHTTAVISCYTVAAQSITHTATVRIGDGRTIRTIQVSQRIDVGSGLAATGVRTPTQLLAGGVLVGLGTALLLAARRRSVR